MYVINLKKGEGIIFDFKKLLGSNMKIFCSDPTTLKIDAPKEIKIEKLEKLEKFIKSNEVA
jgi:hypothetical protein